MEATATATCAALVEAQRKSAESHGRLASLQEQLAQAEAEVAETQAAMRHAEAEAAAVRKKVESSEEATAKLDELSAAEAADLDKMQAELAQAEGVSANKQVEMRAKAKTKSREAAELDLVIVELAERLRTVQMTLHETKEATDTAAARAQADREELAKAAVEKQLLDQEVAGLRSRVEAAAGVSEAVKVAKLDHRLCQLEKRLQSSHTTAETEPAEGTGTTAAAPAMTDSEMFRLRMKLISQGYTSAEADRTIAEAMQQEGVRFEEPTPPKTCCGCSENFCAGMCCGLITGAVCGTGAVLGVTFSAVIAPYAVMSYGFMKTSALFVAHEAMQAGTATGKLFGC
mmetsp:Transcript_44171/g.84416  ORF Transcript_44171/g.84416 Transcript_44171/m.84416 type:complete len:344 (-) Transcript_44171:218-1249(-)